MNGMLNSYKRTNEGRFLKVATPSRTFYHPTPLSCSNGLTRKPGGNYTQKPG